MEFQKLQKVEFKKKSAKKMYETQQNLPKRKKEKRKEEPSRITNWADMETVNHAKTLQKI